MAISTTQLMGQGFAEQELMGLLVELQQTGNIIRIAAEPNLQAEEILQTKTQASAYTVMNALSGPFQI